MPAPTQSQTILGPLLRGEAGRLTAWLSTPVRPWWESVGLIVVGAGLYGAAVGGWRSPLQATFTATKLPLILLLTAGGNAALNAILAPLLGLNLGWRQTVLAILASFAIGAVILGSVSPLVWFQIWNLPAMEAGWDQRGQAFYLVQVTQVGVIAFAGIAGNLRLHQLLHHISGSVPVARRVLWAWLGANFLLGTQITWILRPLFGAPELEVQFLRPHPFQGNFFETIWSAARHLAGNP